MFNWVRKKVEEFLRDQIWMRVGIQSSKSFEVLNKNKQNLNSQEVMLFLGHLKCGFDEFEGQQQEANVRDHLAWGFC